MIFTFPDEYEKYLTSVLGDGWNCKVSSTPPNVVKYFKDFNAYVKKTFDEPEVVHFV